MKFLKSVEEDVLDIVDSLYALFIQLLKAISKWFDGKKMLFTSILAAVGSVLSMYGEYQILTPAQLVLANSILNLFFMAISSGKSLFEWGYKVGSLMFWSNIIGFGYALADIWLKSGMIDNKLAFVFATIMIVLRTINKPK